ncbi:hypothetical protein Tco_0104000 [Tanacetum coccineum]
MNSSLSLSLAQFGQILRIPYNGQAVFTNEWDLASLAYSQETEGPYHTDLPTPDDIQLSQDMKRWEELIRENVFRLGGHRDHLPASLAHIIECAGATSTTNLPYDMFLTRLYQHVMEHYPHLDNGIYNVIDREMMIELMELSRASTEPTPSPTTYLNSLKPLDYQQYDIPTSSEQDDDLLLECQTDLLNQTKQMHKELRGGFKSFGKALRGVFGKKKK